MGLPPRPKKDVRVTFGVRILPEHRAALEKIAKARKWSASQTAEEAIVEFIRRHEVKK